MDSVLLVKIKSDYFDVQPILCDNSFTFVLCVKYLDWNSNFSSNNIVLEPSSYRETQLITLYANQLRTKTLANLHSRALALMREPHIQTIYLCNVYPFCLSSKIHYPVFRLFFFFTLPISNSLSPEHYKDICHTVYILIKMLFPFSKCMNVFNLSEEAVNRCKALISVSYDPPSLFYLHTLFIPEGQTERVRDSGVFEAGPHPPRKS